VGGHDGLGDGQPQPGALDRLSLGDRGAEEALEDPLPVRDGDADTGVGHREHGLGAFRPEPDLDLPAIRGELKRIGQEVTEELGDARRVEGEVRNGGGGEHQVDLLALSLGAHLRHDTGDDGGQVGAAELRRQLSRIDLVQQLQVPGEA